MAQGKFSAPRNRWEKNETQPLPKKDELTEFEQLFAKNGKTGAPKSDDSRWQLSLDLDEEASSTGADSVNASVTRNSASAGGAAVETKSAGVVQPAAEPTPTVYNRDSVSKRPSYVPDVPEKPEYNDDEPIEEDDVEADPGYDGENNGFFDRLRTFTEEHRIAVLSALIAAAAVLVVGIILVIYFSVGGNSDSSDPYGSVILNNVYVAGVNVGGMTRSQAISAVKKATAGTYTKQDMVITFSDGTLTLKPEKTGASLEVKDAVDAAYSYGRTGTDSEKQADYTASLTSSYIVDLLPYLTLDTDYISSAISEYASRYEGTFQQSGYKLEGEQPPLNEEDYSADNECQTLVLTVGTPGFGLDPDELYNNVIDAYCQNVFTVEVGDVPEDATPDELDLDAIYEELYIAPVSSVIDADTDEITYGSYGYGFDLEDAKSQLAAAEYGDVLRIPMIYIEPETAVSSMFQDVLGSCETPHTSNENRNENLKLLCETLNGMIIQPGETFSYNEALGERTAEKGYKKAPAYSGQELVDVVGGGVCQGSSTLYYCALLADMEIVERHNHGFRATYIDYGMDATVSWPDVDLKFTNTSEYPIKIEAEVSDGYVKMKLLGTETRDYYIEMEYEVTGTADPAIVYEEHSSDEGYTDGEVLEEGREGVYVKTYKLKYSRETGNLISKDFCAYSSYQTKSRVIVKIVDDETEATTEETQATTEATQATTETTQATTEATQATTEATQATTEATQATTEATQATTEATQATTEATQATTEATQTTTEATQATTEATQATTEATQATTEASQAPQESGTQASEAASEP